MRKNSVLRALAWALVCLIALAPAALAQSADVPSVECGVSDIQKYGNLVLDVSTNALVNQGYAYGDLLTVEIAGRTLEMPFVDDFFDVDTGAPVCVAKPADAADDSANTVRLAISLGDLATWLGVATKQTIDEDPGFRWDYADEYKDGISVKISMEEQGGYAQQLMLHELNRSDDRADYPNLTDEEFANFRNIATTGMGKNVLYRSSSPINPELGRNKQADAATNAAGIRTVVNLADSEKVMKGYEDYAYTYYSELDIIPLDLILDFYGEDFHRGLVEGFRFIIDHEGPYLLHCTEGRNRAGVASAMLECLMGATAEEVVGDYMVTFYNYFGILPGDEKYDAIADSEVKKIMNTLFGVDDLAGQGVDLAACAETWLLDGGMSKDEIAALKARLSTDIL